MIQISKKICMLGSFGVGKTSLVRRFVYDKFDEKYLSTIGVQISQKTIESLKDHNKRNVLLRFILWDIAHIEKINDVIKNYFRGSHGAIIVCDITRTQTFSDLELFLKPYLQMNPTSKLAFVANKIDLVDDSKFKMEQLLHIEKLYQSKFIFTSSKTGENVEKLFINLGKSILEAH
ncbi:GTP-binding protein [candidate division KSB1 bacterium]|nr:GTP-binding protein [candidate division KSB1 bacterium]